MWEAHNVSIDLLVLSVASTCVQDMESRNAWGHVITVSSMSGHRVVG